MAYPSALTYDAVPQMPGFTREYHKLPPENKTTYDAGDVIEFRLPTALAVDMTSLRLTGQVLGVKASGTDVLSLPRHIESFVHRVSVTVNNVVIDDVSFANVLWHMKSGFVKPNSGREVLELDVYYDGKATPLLTQLPTIGVAATDLYDTVAGGAIPGRAGVTRPVPAALAGINAHNFALKLGNVSGFCDCGKVLDINYIGEMIIRVYLARDNIMAGTNCTYQMQNVAFTFSSVKLRDPAYLDSLSTQIQIPFRRNIGYYNNKFDVAGRFPFAVPTRCLNALLGSLIYNDNLFDRLVPADMTMRWEVSGRFYPALFDVTMADAFAMAQSAAADSDCQLTSWDEWVSKKSVFIHRFSYDAAMEPLSGMDPGKNEPIHCAMLVSKSSQHRPIVFAECASIMHVTGQRSVAVTW
jgi:hypothetical protein